jgi:cyanate permease
MSETIENGKNSTQIEDRLVEDQKSSELKNRTNLSKSQIITIVLLSFFFFLTSSYYSLLAPFLPQEAIKKGMSQTQIGIIFGVYQLILLVLRYIL